MGAREAHSKAQERIEELKQAQGLEDGQPPRSNRVQKKRDAIVRTCQEPVLPRLGKILFFSMLLLTALMLVAEVSTYLRYSSHLGVEHILSNLSVTGTGIWGLYTALLLPVCIAGCLANAKRFRGRQQESGTEDHTEEDRARSARAIRRLNRSFLRYLAVSLAGLVLWGLFFLAVPHV